MYSNSKGSSCCLHFFHPKAKWAVFIPIATLPQRYIIAQSGQMPKVFLLHSPQSKRLNEQAAIAPSYPITPLIGFLFLFLFCMVFFNFQLYFTESHNSWVWKRPLELILSNPPTQTGLCRSGFKGLCADGFWINVFISFKTFNQQESLKYRKASI